ncbi:sulfotransferase 1C4-like [Artemia franciscana]|uniref:Sulfotransferase domain-containing protein n=1 Tax=Artemia franciscana TaxID=6661 RepID=A0AA88L0C4_ARTSF|nr:hypothetical protein QYM36_012693 [Artemia franciscana]
MEDSVKILNSQLPENWELKQFDSSSSNLWKGFPYFYRHTEYGYMSRPGLGDPFILQSCKADFVPHSSDVNITSFPKAGTTWMQEIAYLVDHMDLEYDESPLDVRCPFLEVRLHPLPAGLDILPTLSYPRHLKWHSALDLLPSGILENSKVIHIARNPKDLCVSYYHFARMNKHFGFVGSFNDFFDCFIKGEVPFGPFWENILSFWRQRDHPNLLFITYEELQDNLERSISKVGEFLGRELTVDQIADIASRVTFDAMSTNPLVNHSHWDKLGLRVSTEATFFRKGKVGDWMEHFSEEQNEIMNRWIEVKSADTGLKFQYTL